MKRNVAFIVFLLLFIACKKEQVEITEFNKNCAISVPVTAEFTMTEIGDGSGGLETVWHSETDSIWGGSAVYFSALEDNAEYTWYIGSEIIHEREFYKVFPSVFDGETFPMTLVVKKQPNLICFPNDDGWDSVVKPLSMVHEPSYYIEPIHYEGNYRLKKETSTDSIDVEIELRLYDETNGGVPFHPWSSFVIINLDLCDEIHGRVVGSTTYRKVWLTNTWHGAKEKCPNVNGFTYHKQMDGVVHIVGHYKDGTEFNYYGRKLS